MDIEQTSNFELPPEIMDQPLFVQEDRTCGESCILAAAAIAKTIRVEDRKSYERLLNNSRDLLGPPDSEITRSVQDLKRLAAHLNLTVKEAFLPDMLHVPRRRSLLVFKIQWNGYAGISNLRMFTGHARHFILVLRLDNIEAHFWEPSFENIQLGIRSPLHRAPKAELLERNRCLDRHVEEFNFEQCLVINM